MARQMRGALAAAVLVAASGCADSSIEAAIKASDVEVVRTELATASAAGKGLPRFAFAALVHSTVATNRGTKGRIYFAAPVEVAARRWSPDGVRVLLDNGLMAASDAVQGALVDAAANGSDPIITMIRQLSGSKTCEANVNWTWGFSGITVWGGCRAEFEFVVR